MRRGSVLPVLILTTMLMAGCGEGPVPPASAEQPPVRAREVAFEFDGGFAYLTSSSRIDVAGVGQVAGMPEHRLKLGVLRQNQYDAAATTLKPSKVANFLAFDLTGYDAVVAPGGTVASEGRLALPPEGSGPAVCGNLEEESTEANRLQHLLDLTALHPNASVNQSKIASTLALTDGEFRIRRAGYCWQLERGTEKRLQGRLVQGVLGMGYKLNVDAPYVDIKLARRGTKDFKDTIRLLPGANGVVNARISTGFNDMKTTVKPNQLDPHFDMFYALLNLPQPGSGTALRAGDMPFKARYIVKITPDSPGDDCLSVRIAAPATAASRSLQ